MIRSKPLIIDQLREASGVVKVAAMRLQVGRRTLSEWIRADPELQQVVRDCREEVKDVVEGQLISKAAAGELGAVIFYLRTQARDRGYGDKVDATLSAPDGGPVQHQEVPFDFAAAMSELNQDERDVLRRLLERSTAQPDGGTGRDPGA